MRVVECQICGALLGAANEAELADCLQQHYEAKHEGLGFDTSQARDFVASQSYEATDS